jgi:hypothetical protein
MAELKRTFTGGKMDKDTDERIVQNGLYREALNISIATSEDSDVGAAQNILGNTKVTEVIQHRSYVNGEGGEEYFGANYHVAAIVNPQTNMLYRFVHTASPDQGIWMDRILEFDTSKKIHDPWDEKEHAVFVDIFKVHSNVQTYEEDCQEQGTSTTSTISITRNANQVRWGMRVEGTDATVVEVDYSDVDKKITLNKTINYSQGQSITFLGDRNLNFGNTGGGQKLRSITGINVVDDMIFWTDNVSEPKKINIERSKDGCDSGKWNIGRGTKKIDDFNQHTLLVVEDANPVDTILDESGCFSAQGCTDPSAINYDAKSDYDCSGADIYDNSYISPNSPSDPGWSCCVYRYEGCTDVNSCTYDPEATFNDGSCCYITGCIDDGWCVVDQATADTNNAMCPTNCDGLSSPWHACGFDTPDPTNNLVINHGSGACNFDPNACCSVQGDILEDSITTPSGYTFAAGTEMFGCVYVGCLEGCTDPAANNLDPNATIDDGSCTYDTVWIVNTEDPCECIEVAPGGRKLTWPSELDCETANLTLQTTGCCATAPVYGCMDILANNYDPNAGCPCDATLMGCDNGTDLNNDAIIIGNCDGPGSNECCEYELEGCTDPMYSNYNPLATVDNGSCEGIPGCTDPLACNHDCATTINPTSTVPCGDNVTTDDGTCDYVSCAGCTDSNANNYNINATIDDGSCTYDQTWDCDPYYNCVEIFGGTPSYPGGFTSLQNCVDNCVEPSFDCINGTCFDPGTGNGAFASMSICQNHCSPFVIPSWDCDVSGSNAGSCYDPGTGNGFYNSTNGGLTQCELDCVVIPETWDCDGNGICSQNMSGTGAYTSAGACNTWCNIRSSWDCDGNGNCINPGTGNGQYTNPITCHAACSNGTTEYDCDPHQGCIPTPGGQYSGFTDCITNSNCKSMDAYWCDGGPQCRSGSWNACITATNNINDCYWTQWDCDGASNSCEFESYTCNGAGLGACSDPGAGSGDFVVDGISYTTGTAALNACQTSTTIPSGGCYNGVIPDTYDCVISAGNIGCVLNSSGTGGYTDAGATTYSYADAQTYCESDINNSTVAGCRDWSSYCDNGSCTSNPGGIAAHGNDFGNPAVNSLTNTSAYYGTYGPSDMATNKAGIETYCTSNCAAPAVPPCQDPGAYNYNQGTDPCYYPGCCADHTFASGGPANTTPFVLPAYTAKGAGQTVVGGVTQTTDYAEFDYTNPPNSSNGNGPIGPNNPHPGCSQAYPYFWYALWGAHWWPANQTWGLHASEVPVNGVTQTGAIIDAHNTAAYPNNTPTDVYTTGNPDFANTLLNGTYRGYCIDFPSQMPGPTGTGGSIATNAWGTLYVQTNSYTQEPGQATSSYTHCGECSGT